MDPVDVWVLKEQLEFVPLMPINYHKRILEGEAGLCTEMLLSNLQYKGKLLTASVVYWSEFLATDLEARVRFSALQKKSSGPGTGSAQPHEYKWEATW
jgi:hypothetical protein